MSTGEETTPATTSTGTQNNVVPLAYQPERLPAHKQAARFVREHPVATIAGGLAIGAVAAALIPRGNRRYVARQGSMLADAIAAASATIAHQALSSLDSASSTVRSGAHSLASRASDVGEAAAGRAERTGHALYGRAQSLLGRKPAPTFTERLAERLGEIAGRVRC